MEVTIEFFIEGEEDPAFITTIDCTTRNDAANAYKVAYERFREWLVERVQFSATVHMGYERPAPALPDAQPNDVPPGWFPGPFGSLGDRM